MTRKVLLIDDDRLQFRVTQANFEQFRSEKLVLEWADTYETGLKRLLSGGYAACLLDYQLGDRDGLELIRAATAAGCRTPIIFITADSAESVDMQAMEAGAYDYLVKAELTARTLERSLRYALKLSESLEALRKLAIRDELTGLINRREFERILAEEDERSRRFGRPCALIMLDLDHFKLINDTHGHPAGDTVLRGAAGRILTQLRSVDRLARIGGEEFAALLTEVDHMAAAEIAQRIVSSMEATPIVLPDKKEIYVTVSAGSAAMPGNAGDPTGLIAAADKALYEAKARGRNCAVAAV